MAVNVTDLRADNAQILNTIRANATPDYQHRVPEATKANQRDVIDNLMNYRAHKNEFIDALINRIGSFVARNISWQNPLAEFKQGLLSWGDTVEEVQTGLLKAHTYDSDRDKMESTLFGTERPPVQSNFHTVSRQEFYKITVNETLLRRAFLSDDGLQNYVTQLMEAPATSDQLDEFLSMCRLFPQYESNGGFYHVRVPNVRSLASTAEDAKLTLRRMRELIELAQFPSSRYNAAKMPTFARPEDLVVFATPAFRAAIDVEALAAAYNIERADIPNRIISIPDEHFGIDGCQAILTTRDFFQVYDVVLENTSQPNAADISTNFFLHHHEIISASRFVPAIMLTDNRDDEVITIQTAPTAVAKPVLTDVNGATVSVSTGKLTPGAIYQATTTVTPDTADSAVQWSVQGATSPFTQITETGVLHIGANETAAKLTIKAATVWLDPANVRNDAVSNSTDYSVDTSTAPAWPVTGKLTELYVKGNAVGVTDGTDAYDVPESIGDAQVTDVSARSAGPVSVNVTKTAPNKLSVAVDPGRPGSVRTIVLTLKGVTVATS